MFTKNDQIENLQELNDELENYFRNTIIPQLFVDADLILQKFTPPAMKQFKLSAADVGKSISEVIDNTRFPSIIENIHHVIASNEILEKEIQTNEFRWYQMNIIPYVAMRTNKTNGVIITFVEITMRIKDLREQERLNADHEILLDTISHDIKTPLTNLVLAIDLYKNASAEDIEESKMLFTIVENAVRKMTNIIGELTDARKDEHKYKSESELLNFEHILEDVRLTLNENIRESGTVIKSDIGISEITFSRRKLRSIVYNLVSNAIKFRSQEGKCEIIIKTVLENGFIIISVKDNGIGVDEAKQETIFYKYYRVENAIEGSGVGLYLVKEIVNNAGGKIVLESVPGKGSEFKVYLKVE